MTVRQHLAAGLDAFAVQFSDQVTAAGAPEHEHAIHFCLALGLQSSRDWQPGSIIFERALGARRIDLWIAPWDLAIEVKYQRPIPSGRNRPFPQLYGGLLADLNKVAGASASERLVVLVTDTRGFAYLKRNNHDVLPLELSESARILPDTLASLSATAHGGALTHGAWTGLECSVVWTHEVNAWHLLAWHVEPLRLT